MARIGFISIGAKCDFSVRFSAHFKNLGTFDAQIAWAALKSTQCVQALTYICLDFAVRTKQENEFFFFEQVGPNFGTLTCFVHSYYALT